MPTRCVFTTSSSRHNQLFEADFASLERMSWPADAGHPPDEDDNGDDDDDAEQEEPGPAEAHPVEPEPSEPEPVTDLTQVGLPAAPCTAVE